MCHITISIIPTALELRFSLYFKVNLSNSAMARPFFFVDKTTAGVPKRLCSSFCEYCRRLKSQLSFIRATSSWARLATRYFACSSSSKRSPSARNLLISSEILITKQTTPYKIMLHKISHSQPFRAAIFLARVWTGSSACFSLFSRSSVFSSKLNPSVVA